MRKVKNYKISRESQEDMCKARRFNPCLEITFKDRTGTHTHKLNAGYHDNIYVYRENGQTYILTQNTYLGYVGLETFNGSEQIGDLFLEYHKLIEVLGKSDFAPFTMIHRLKEYIIP